MQTYKIRNVIFYEDGTWHYVDAPPHRLYAWKYENCMLHWAPCKDLDMAYWIPWQNDYEMVKEFRRQVIDPMFERIVILGEDDGIWKA